MRRWTEVRIRMKKERKIIWPGAAFNKPFQLSQFGIYNVHFFGTASFIAI